MNPQPITPSVPLSSNSVALRKQRHLCSWLASHEAGVGPGWLVKREAADGGLQCNHNATVATDAVRITCIHSRHVQQLQ